MLRLGKRRRSGPGISRRLKAEEEEQAPELDMIVKAKNREKKPM